MPSDPQVPIMEMDEAIQSVLVLNPEELLSKDTIKALTLLTTAAAHPTPVPREQFAMVAQWALWTRAQDMLLQLVLSKRMTVFPQADGTMKFGGALMKIDEAAAKVANIEASKIIKQDPNAPGPVPNPTPVKVPGPEATPAPPLRTDSHAYEEYTRHLSICDACEDDTLCPTGTKLQAAWLDTKGK